MRWVVAIFAAVVLLACGSSAMRSSRITNVEISSIAFYEARVTFYCNGAWLRTVRGVNLTKKTSARIPYCSKLSFRVRWFATREESETYEIIPDLTEGDILSILIGHRLNDITWYTLGRR